MSRGDGKKIPPSTRARAAIALAKGASKAGTARKLGFARESLRQWFEKDDFASWVDHAKDLLRRGWREHAIENELIVHGAPEEQEASPEEKWALVVRFAQFVAASAKAWNDAHRADLLESDPAEVVALAAALFGESEPGPGCRLRDRILLSFLDVLLELSPTSSTERITGIASSGKFIPIRRMK
jgi:hypothetical protein